MTCRAIVVAFVVACGGQAARPDSVGVAGRAEGPVALRNGANTIDLLGDGTPAEAFVAWRGNYNAHGFSTVAIYLRARSDLGDSLPDWQIVPRFGGPNVETTGREIFATREGADCTLGDLRIVQHRGTSAELIIARRELGNSFADSAATHFDYYKLSQNADGEVGWPPFYFEFVRTVDARRAYCDVNVAFEQELGLGRAGLGRGEGLQ